MTPNLRLERQIEVLLDTIGIEAGELAVGAGGERRSLAPIAAAKPKALTRIAVACALRRVAAVPVAARLIAKLADLIGCLAA